MYRFLRIVGVATIVFTLVWLVVIFPSVWAFALGVILLMALVLLFRGRDPKIPFFEQLWSNKLIIIVFSVLLGIGMYTSHTFNLKSLVKMFFNTGELKMKMKIENADTDADMQFDFIQEYKDSSVLIQSLEFERDAGFIRSAIDFGNPNKIYFVEFNDNNRFQVFSQLIDDTIIPSNCNDVLDSSGFGFAVNLNFYDPQGKARGGYQIDENYFTKLRQNDGDPFHKWGNFKIIEGKPYVGSIAYFEKIKGVVSQYAQCYPLLIENGEVRDYITKGIDSYGVSHGLGNRLKVEKLRNVIGVKEDKLVCILSNNGAYLTFPEMATICQEYGLDQATCFDGGFPLQYEFRTENFNISFCGNNNRLSIGDDVENLILENMNSRINQKSPVFLIVKGE